MEEQKRDNQKNQEIVLLRGIGIISVILFHVFNHFMDINGINGLIITSLIICNFASLGVPLFIFISGFVLSKRYQLNYKWISFWKKRIKRILPPYIIFALIYYFIFKISFNPFYIETKGYGIIKTLLFELFIGQNHLWYILLIIQFYLIYPVLDKIINNNTKKCVKLFIFSFILQIIVTILYIPFKEYLDALYLPTYINTIVNSIINRLFLFYIGYFVFGILLNRIYIKFNESNQKNSYIFTIWLLIICIIIITSLIEISGIRIYSNDINIPSAFLLPNLILVNFLYLFLIIVLYDFCIKLKSDKFQFLRIIGKYSFGIYLIHFGIIFFLTITFTNFVGITIEDWYYYPIVLFLTIIMSYFLTRIISRFRYHEYIIGKID